MIVVKAGRLRFQLGAPELSIMGVGRRRALELELELGGSSPSFRLNSHDRDRTMRRTQKDPLHCFRRDVQGRGP